MSVFIWCLTNLTISLIKLKFQTTLICNILSLILPLKDIECGSILPWLHKSTDGMTYDLYLTQHRLIYQSLTFTKLQLWRSQSYFWQKASQFWTCPMANPFKLYSREVDNRGICPPSKFLCPPSILNLPIAQNCPPSKLSYPQKK